MQMASPLPLESFQAAGTTWRLPHFALASRNGSEGQEGPPPQREGGWVPLRYCSKHTAATHPLARLQKLSAPLDKHELGKKLIYVLNVKSPPPKPNAQSNVFVSELRTLKPIVQFVTDFSS